MICLTSARGRLLNVSIAINRPIVIAYCAYCLFLISLYFCFRSCLLYIFVCMYFFSFDATILVNKDVYITYERMRHEAALSLKQSGSSARQYIIRFNNTKIGNKRRSVTARLKRRTCWACDVRYKDDDQWQVNFLRETDRRTDGQICLILCDWLWCVTVRVTINRKVEQRFIVVGRPTAVKMQVTSAVKS